MGIKGRILTGARARLLINGIRVGYATGIDGGETIDHEELNVLDNVEVEENVPVKYRARFSAALVRVVGETLKSMGIFPKTGQNASDHLKNILTNGDLTIAVEDNQTGKIVEIIEQCKATSRTWNVAAVGMGAYNVEFNCIRAKDETEA